ncbi:MAG: TonB family protein [Hyphomicrobiales bacterium]|nr:TonB family protein [Hyphomicrobiales bacterium]
MTETDFNDIDRASEEGNAPAPWDESDLELDGKVLSDPTRASILEAPCLSVATRPLGLRTVSFRRSERGFLGTAVSLAAHALVIAAVLLHAPWDLKGSLEDENEITVEIVDSLPEPAASQEQARPPEPHAKASDAEAAPVQPPPEGETQAPVSEAETSAPPLAAAPPPVEVPPSLPAPVTESELQSSPPVPAPVETPPAPAVREAQPPNAPVAVDLSQQERVQRLAREKREEAERAVRERAARAAENAKRQEALKQEALKQEALKQEAQRQAAQRQETERQARAKAGEIAAANAAAASAYRNGVLARLASFKRYPPTARARGAQGSPAVSFSIDSSGHVVGVTLTRASGDPDLDAEIVAMVHKASPFPPPPPGAPHSFSASVNFRLE